MARNVCTTAEIILELEGILSLLRIQMIIIIHLYLKRRQLGRRQQGRFTRPYSLVDKMHAQVKHLNRLVRVCDVDCFDNLRMDRNTFGKLCRLLKELGGMRDGRFVTVEEQVAMFLGILAHHKKSRIVRFDFMRSGYTVSKYVHAVLRALLDIYKKNLAKPDPVTDDSTDSRWKHFKGCIGALDGTYINVLVSNADKPRYRTRKGQIATNTLAVCDRQMRFIYALPGWEGSAGDSRVLKDAVSREYGLKVPKG